MDTSFQISECIHHCVKRRNITIEHILHCFVICGQCCKAIIRGNQFQSAGNSFLILCPRSRIELHFEVYYRFQQVHPRKSGLFHRRHRHPIQVIVMPGITLRHFRTFGSVGFMVQDRRLFPESPLRRNGQNCRILLCKNFWIVGCCIGLNLRNFCRSPSSQRPNLQTNDLQGGRVCDRCG